MKGYKEYSPKSFADLENFAYELGRLNLPDRAVVTFNLRTDYFKQICKEVVERFGKGSAFVMGYELGAVRNVIFLFENCTISILEEAKYLKK